MKIKLILLIVTLLIGLSPNLHSQEDDTIYTIYLVRHAEKEVSKVNPKDPGLTECGIERAKSISLLLKDVNLDKVYSSDYIRTKNTAEPIATQMDKEIILYDPRELNDIAEILLRNKEDAIVVGHSNTTGVLAGLLVGEEIKPMSEDIYNRIYQVIISKNDCKLNVFHSSFECKK